MTSPEPATRRHPATGTWLLIHAERAALAADPRRVITSTTKPPLPAVAMLGGAIVHGQDIRQPLGIHRDYPITTLTRVADYYQGSDLVVPAKERIRGLRLTATDSAFTAGSGPAVSGTTLALIMAMTGRTRYCDELGGDGVAILRGRHAAARP